MVSFKARPAVKQALAQMARLRGNEMGDSSISGLLLGMVYEEAKRRNVVIEPEPDIAAEPAPKPAKRARKR